MFQRILIANRGEIALRVIRTAREMGIECVAVYSDLDAQALHTRMAHRAVALGGATPARAAIDEFDEQRGDRLQPGSRRLQRVALDRNRPALVIGPF